MTKSLFLAVTLTLAASHLAHAQFSGSAGENRSRPEGSPAQQESAKRQQTVAEAKDDGTATFLDASVLMNVPADEYVAVFGAMAEGKTPEEAATALDATIASFKAGVKAMGISDTDIFVDFVSQNRIYAFKINENAPKDKDDDQPDTTPARNNNANANGYATTPGGKNNALGYDTGNTITATAKEELVGFELKKNISIHFKDKLLVDQLALVAARAQIFDLIKVDYVVKDREAILARLQTQTMALLKRKADLYSTTLGIKLPSAVQIVADKPSVYYPVEQYDSYVASESETLSLPYNRATVQNARKSRTTYFNPLSGNGFDTVINPTIIEPVVQFTTYIKVKYAAPTKRKK